MIKKNLILLSLIFIIVSCTLTGNSINIIGRWYLSSVRGKYAGFTNAIYSKANSPFFIEFKNDNTYKFSQFYSNTISNISIQTVTTGRYIIDYIGTYIEFTNSVMKISIKTPYYETNIFSNIPYSYNDTKIEKDRILFFDFLNTNNYLEFKRL